MKTLKTQESKKLGSFTVTVNKASTDTVWFNLDKRGGAAKYNLATGEFEPCRNEVGERFKSALEAAYIS
jgi:hypothetical protein